MYLLTVIKLIYFFKKIGILNVFLSDSQKMLLIIKYSQCDK